MILVNTPNTDPTPDCTACRQNELSLKCPGHYHQPKSIWEEWKWGSLQSIFRLHDLVASVMIQSDSSNTSDSKRASIKTSSVDIDSCRILEMTTKPRIQPPPLVGTYTWAYRWTMDPVKWCSLFSSRRIPCEFRLVRRQMASCLWKAVLIFWLV